MAKLNSAEIAAKMAGDNIKSVPMAKPRKPIAAVSRLNAVLARRERGH